MTRNEAIKAIAELANQFILAGADEGKLAALFRKNVEALEVLGWVAPVSGSDEPKTPAQVFIESMIERTVWVRPINSAFAAYDSNNKMVPGSLDKTIEGATRLAKELTGGTDNPYAHIEFIAVHTGDEQRETPPPRLRRMRAA